MRLTDYFLVIPDVPLIIVIAALFGRSTWNIIVIIGSSTGRSPARLIRAQTKSVRERVYVQRARALGARNSRLILRHVLPQVTPLLVANTVLLIAYAIFAETFISFLGLGDPTAISWGRLIQNAFTDDAIINEAWWAVIPPGVLRDARRPRLHDHRPDDGGRAQSAPPHRPSLGAPLPRAPSPPTADAAAAVSALSTATAAAVVNPPLLEVDDLHVWFDLPNGRKLHAVQGVSFSVEAGRGSAWSASPGCGKTTTILALMGLPAADRIRLRAGAPDGVDVLERGEESHRAAPLERTSRWSSRGR
jgi:hypothetical protein